MAVSQEEEVFVDLDSRTEAEFVCIEAIKSKRYPVEGEDKYTPFAKMPTVYTYRFRHENGQPTAASGFLDLTLGVPGAFEVGRAYRLTITPA